MSKNQSIAEAPWRASWRAARANVLPGLVLQAGALALVLAYYYHSFTRAWLERLANFRASQGFVFGIVSTGLVGGVIPLLYLWSRSRTRERYRATQGLGLIAFWAYKGLEIELFYRFLALVIGEVATPAVIVGKMVTDQFIYCPLFAVPVTTLVYAWIDARYEFAPVRADVRQGNWYRRRVLPLLIPNLVVWIPAVCIIYALPTALQLPLQNLVLCFFTLLLAHVTKENAPDAVASPASRPVRI
jgi:hypothetical protein